MTHGDLFPPGAVADIRVVDMIQELALELKVRRRVYPRLSQRGKLDAFTADRRILTIRAIIKKLRDENP